MTTERTIHDAVEKDDYLTVAFDEGYLSIVAHEAAVGSTQVDLGLDGAWELLAVTRAFLGYAPRLVEHLRLHGCDHDLASEGL